LTAAIVPGNQWEPDVVPLQILGYILQDVELLGRRKEPGVADGGKSSKLIVCNGEHPSHEHFTRFISACYCGIWFRGKISISILFIFVSRAPKLKKN
jgi:hypothetical protein